MWRFAPLVVDRGAAQYDAFTIPPSQGPPASIAALAPPREQPQPITNTLLMQPGMTFSDEPGIYIRGEFGVRLEDDMVITADGAELFTPQSRSLDDPFADVP